MRPILLAALSFLALLLSGCSGADRQQALVCVAVATAIGPAGHPVTIASVEPYAAIDNTVRVIFTVAGIPRAFFADCVFGGGAFSSRRTELLAVRGLEGRMPDWRLALMKRWFLDQPGAIPAAVAETGWSPPALELAPVSLPASIGYALQQFVNALNLAAFYVPLAVAYAMIYGLVGRLNMAFGELAMIGAFGAVFGLVSGTMAHLPSLALLLVIAFACAGSLAALAGYVIARAVALPLMERPGRSFIVATVGLGIAMAEGLRLTQGTREIWLQPMLGDPLVLAGGDFPVVITGMRLLVLAISAAAMIALLVSMRRSTFGRAWRAVADDRLMARLSGIDTAAVTALSFIIASAVAALAGTILALSYGGTSHAGGFLLGLKALVACLVGGGTIGGALAGGLLLAALETGWSGWFSVGDHDLFVLSAITLLFLVRPEGLFGRRPALEEGRIIRLS